MTTRPVVPATADVEALRERLWAVVPSIDRTMSHGRALIMVRDEAGRLEWREIDTFTAGEAGGVGGILRACVNRQGRFLWTTSPFRFTRLACRSKTRTSTSA